MMMTHETERLSAYLDRELDDVAALAVESHIADCAECRATLAGLRQVVDAADSLDDGEPAADLWPGILQRIESVDDVAVLALRTTPAASPARRFSFSLPQLAAAAMVLVAVSGASVWIALRTANPGARPNGEAPVAATTPAVSAARLVSATVETYDDAIRELEARLTASRPHLDAATIAVVEQNLRIIDTAIGEARAALAGDPADAWLYRHLDDTLMRKVDLLRHATTLRRIQT
jgi:anti-sigma factor RsiW